MTLGAELNDLEWRSGSVIDAASIEALVAMLHAAGRPDLSALCQTAGARVLVVSQWCDLVHDPADDEPYVELLVAAAFTPTPNEQPQTFLKSYRRLDLEVGGEWVTLLAKNRVQLPREKLLELTRDGARELPMTHALNVQRWLGMRYSRYPLPGKLDTRLDLRKPPAEKLLNALAPHIFEVRVKVTPEDKELEDDQPYHLEIYVVASVPLTTPVLTKAYDAFKSWAEGLTPAVNAKVHLTDGDAFTLKMANETRRLSLDSFTFRKKGKKGPHPTDEGDGV